MKKVFHCPLKKTEEVSTEVHRAAFGAFKEKLAEEKKKKIELQSYHEKGKSVIQDILMNSTSKDKNTNLSVIL